MWSNSRYSPRPEARPFHWKTLDVGQRRAFEEVVHHLHAAVGHASYGKASNDAWPFRLDRGRVNRNILVSGDRGIGKSSLMLSLIRCFVDAPGWRNDWDGMKENVRWTVDEGRVAARKDDVEAAQRYLERVLADAKPAREIELARQRIASAQSEAGKAETEESTNLEEMVSHLRGKLEFLEPLDVEVLPSSTNLLAAVMARIEQCVEHRTAGIAQRDRDTRDEPSLLQSIGHNPLDRFAKIQKNVAWAWTESMRHRESTLDPLALVGEMRDAENARLSFQDRFGRALDDLATGYHWRVTDEPIFVLPVDDFDTNPVRVIDLCWMMKLLGGPRLVTLLFGNADVAEAMLRLNFRGQAKEIAQEISVGDIELAETVGGTPHYALRKMMPPGHRVMLEPMSVDESRAYSPPRDESAGSGNDLPCLDRLLELLCVEMNTAVLRSNGEAKSKISLAEFLFAIKPSEDRRGKGERWKGGRYSGAALFRSPPRLIADMWYAFHECVDAKDKSASPSVIGAFARLFREAVSEEASLSRAEKHHMLRTARHDFTGRWEFHPEYIEPARKRGPELTVSDDKANFSLIVTPIKDWDFRPVQPLADKDTTPRPRSEGHWRCVSDRVTATIIILHDLLAFRTPRGIAGPYLAPDPVGDWNRSRARARVSKKKSGSRERFRDEEQTPRRDPLPTIWASVCWRVATDDHVEIPWFPPPWKTFWEYIHFRAAWNHVLQQEYAYTDESDIMIDRIGRAWIHAATNVLLGDVDPSVDDSGSETDWPTDWPTLRERSNQVAREYFRTPSLERRRLLASWLVHLAAILAPEGGLSGDATGRFFFERGTPAPDSHNMFTCLARAWHKLSARIRRHRREFARPMGRKIDKDDHRGVFGWLFRPELVRGHLLEKADAAVEHLDSDLMRESDEGKKLFTSLANEIGRHLRSMLPKERDEKKTELITSLVQEFESDDESKVQDAVIRWLEKQIQNRNVKAVARFLKKAEFAHVLRKCVDAASAIKDDERKEILDLCDQLDNYGRRYELRGHLLDHPINQALGGVLRLKDSDIDVINPADDGE